MIWRSVRKKKENIGFVFQSLSAELNPDCWLLDGQRWLNKCSYNISSSLRKKKKTQHALNTLAALRPAEELIWPCLKTLRSEDIRILENPIQWVWVSAAERSRLQQTLSTWMSADTYYSRHPRTDLMSLIVCFIQYVLSNLLVLIISILPLFGLTFPFHKTVIRWFITDIFAVFSRLAYLAVKWTTCAENSNMLYINYERNDNANLLISAALPICSQSWETLFFWNKTTPIIKKSLCVI